MDLPCAANSCILFTVLLLIMAASLVHKFNLMLQRVPPYRGTVNLSWRKYTLSLIGSSQWPSLQPRRRGPLRPRKQDSGRHTAGGGRSAPTLGADSSRIERRLPPSHRIHSKPQG